MMSINKCKDLNEWLVGSGASAATATSKAAALLSFGKQFTSNQPVQPGKKGIDEEDVAASDEDEEDWMFRTFDRVKKSDGPDKMALDPFAENEGSFKNAPQP